MRTIDQYKNAAEQELDTLGYDGYRFEEYALMGNEHTREKLHLVSYTVKDGTVRVYLTDTCNIEEVLTPNQETPPYLEGFTYIGNHPSDHF